jgi:hypothetical protein
MKAGDIADLRPLGETLPGAKTTAIAKTEAVEAIRLLVPAGRDIAPMRCQNRSPYNAWRGASCWNSPTPAWS